MKRSYPISPALLTITARSILDTPQIPVDKTRILGLFHMLCYPKVAQVAQHVVYVANLACQCSYLNWYLLNSIQTFKFGIDSSPGLWSSLGAHTPVMSLRQQYYVVFKPIYPPSIELSQNFTQLSVSVSRIGYRVIRTQVSLRLSPLNLLRMGDQEYVHVSIGAMIDYGSTLFCVN